MNLETTATYDAVHEEFELHTPHAAAQKNWISFAAKHAEMAVVFAQLVTPEGESEGVHAFLVTLRKGGKPVGGVRIEDQGHKPCINGNDNGRLFFNGLRVPRGALLDRYASMSKGGKYEGTIPKVRDRFLKVSDQLMSGRMAIAACSVVLAKLAVTSAIRFSVERQQKTGGAKSTTTVPLYNHQTQRRALLLELARCYAFTAGVTATKAEYADMVLEKGTQATDIVIRNVCAFKAYCTQWAVGATSTCREKLGGQGLISANRISDLNAVAASLVVVEGDSMVLGQKVAGELLQSATGGKKSITAALTSLAVGWCRFAATCASIPLLSSPRALTTALLRSRVH